MSHKVAVATRERKLAAIRALQKSLIYDVETCETYDPKLLKKKSF